jgi:hypothetical protein
MLLCMSPFCIYQSSIFKSRLHSVASMANEPTGLAAHKFATAVHVVPLYLSEQYL